MTTSAVSSFCLCLLLLLLLFAGAVRAQTSLSCTHSAMKSALESASSPGSYFLDCDPGTIITFPDSSPIFLKTTITLNGNNAIFDGQGVSRFFVVAPPAPWGILDSNGAGLVVRQLTFRNGWASAEDLIGKRVADGAAWGGQIKDSDGNVVYHPIRSGGAVLVGRDAVVSFTGVTFENCKTPGLAPEDTTSGCANCYQSYDGGAVAHLGGGSISFTDCIFSNNLAYKGADFLYFESVLSPHHQVGLYAWNSKWQPRSTTAYLRTIIVTVPAFPMHLSPHACQGTEEPFSSIKNVRWMCKSRRST